MKENISIMMRLLKIVKVLLCLVFGLFGVLVTLALALSWGREAGKPDGRQVAPRAVERSNITDGLEIVDFRGRLDERWIHFYATLKNVENQGVKNVSFGVDYLNKKFEVVEKDFDILATGPTWFKPGESEPIHIMTQKPHDGVVGFQYYFVEDGEKVRVSKRHSFPSHFNVGFSGSWWY
jgi:hypothetical protein